MIYCCSDGDAVFYDEAGKRKGKQIRMGLARKKLGSETIYMYNLKTQTKFNWLDSHASFTGPELYDYSLEFEASADLIECAGRWKDEELGLVMFR